ncbi:SAM-dependent methyltransferase [Alicyclobacillaceae bacterium I2511]|nr:SAM-dependent methyltransferase [Alicyclobacillaceae bacterium I2511]
MKTQEIVQKLWNLCNVLRDDGITYHQYVTELTYILFLKMMKETSQEAAIPEQYRWDELAEKDGVELMRFYRQLLLDLGTKDNVNGKVKQIYANASTNISAPANLKKIVSSIDDLDWYSAKEEGLGDLYEGLLQKNANEKKSGAGQYFTPRPLINVMVELIDPQPGERCNDPAAGTFGFMIAADQHVRSKTDNYYELSERDAEFQRKQAFTGCELVQDTHRLALMNALLHGMEGEILLGDSLSNLGKTMGNVDVILTNPPFGTKKGGERPTRDDLTFATSNKQLNFLQHIYRALKANGRARAAVVLPDNVLFQDGDGQKIRADLMDKCNLHTVLRLPTGIFYAQGVKTNVLFFTRGETDRGNTKEVWFYDMRTNMPSFGKRTPFTEQYFKDFIAAYQTSNRTEVKDERWSVFTREQIRDKGDNLDLGLIADESLSLYENLPDPIESAEEAIGKLGEAMGLLEQVVQELKAVGGQEE